MSNCFVHPGLALLYTPMQTIGTPGCCKYQDPDVQNNCLLSFLKTVMNVFLFSVYSLFKEEYKKKW